MNDSHCAVDPVARGEHLIEHVEPHEDVLALEAAHRAAQRKLDAASSHAAPVTTCARGTERPCDHISGWQIG